MRALLDGVYLADWVGTLDQLAELSMVDVSRLSWHPDDLLANARALRRAAYFAESDPLRNEIVFDAWQAGDEPDLQPWVDKVLEIKNRFPLPVVAPPPEPVA